LDYWSILIKIKMKQSNKINERIFLPGQLQSQLKWWRLINKKIAFTNGVFDILHEGHIKVLSQAASFADVLIVGVNSDASVKRLKGSSRPVNNQQSRSLILASLIMVDAVIVFDEDTPLHLIEIILPDVAWIGGGGELAYWLQLKDLFKNYAVPYPVLVLRNSFGNI